jgi:hypothetical protein
VVSVHLNLLPWLFYFILHGTQQFLSVKGDEERGYREGKGMGKGFRLLVTKRGAAR